MSEELLKTLLFYGKMVLISLLGSLGFLKIIPPILAAYKNKETVKCWIYGAAFLFLLLVVLHSALQ